jgi:hypothetical protein
VEVLEDVRRADEKSTVKLWPGKQVSTGDGTLGLFNGVRGISLVGRIGRKPFVVDTAMANMFINDCFYYCSLRNLLLPILAGLENGI